MKKFLQILAAAVLAIGLTTGIAAAQTGSLDTTGPGSDNVIRFDNDNDLDVDNDNDVDADVDVDQDADSGDAKVKKNTTGGDAASGDADNEADIEADVVLDNTMGVEVAGEAGCGCLDDAEASIENTGPHSDNRVIFNNSNDVDIDNDNDVDFDVDVDQDATTGDASVYGNTTGGDATTGSASNSSTTVFSLQIHN